ncbi:MAG: peptidylprolyl isomerase [Candidatus Binatia bacterium]
MFVRAKYVGLCLLALVIMPQSLSAAVIEQLIAVIDGEPYTLTNVSTFAKTRLAKTFPSASLQQINAADREVLEQFITDKLMEAEVREAGIRVTDDDVNRYIEQVKKNNRLSDEDFKASLSREGFNLASYTISVKSEMEKAEVIDRQVKRKVNITDEDVERYYKLNAKNYRANERARIRHILLSLPEKAPADQVQRVSAKAKELHQKVAAGEDFAALAREYSEGAGRADGGDIGWVNKGTLIAGLEEVAFDKLSPGKVSEPFRTSMGMHIVKLEAREAGSALPLSAVAPKIKQELLAKAMEERFAKWLKSDLRRKHRVEVKLAGVTFKPEESKEETVNALMARSNRPARREPRSALSYLNPLSYIVSETPFEDQDPRSPVSNKSVVSVFGMPLFVTDNADDTPDIFAPPPPEDKAGQSKGVFSSIVDSLNPFSSKKP